MAAYQTKTGDKIDAISRRYYGRQAGAAAAWTIQREQTVPFPGAPASTASSFSKS